MFSYVSTFHVMILQIIGAEEDIEPKNGLGKLSSSQEKKKRKADITYGIDDIPPWYLCIFMALQVRCLRPCTTTSILPFVGRILGWCYYLKTLIKCSGYLPSI
jgi:hypothetical protein